MITSGNKPIESINSRHVKAQSSSVTVNWTWYDESQGIVSWNFQNNSSEQKSVILYRSGYYFGNAFWPVYVNNGMTYWATSLTPLIDQGVANNTMPIGIIDFGGGNKIIAFIFTFAPGQQWSVLEGGFSSAMQPSGQAVYELSLEKTGSFCIGYDPQQVLDWDLQTGTTMQGYSPNPNNFNTIEVTVPVGTQYIQLFPNDTVSDSPCPPQPNCLQEIEQGIEQGNIDLFLEGVMCVLEQMGYSFKTVLDKFWDKIVEELKKSV
ncbi:MAG: hypothetical protein QW203_03755 [Thermoplasmatales archaeon]